jgi:hypothetical protein
MSTTHKPTDITLTASAAPAGQAQAKRSAALEFACRKMADLDILILNAVKEDRAKPIRQKDRHALVSRAREQLRVIEATLKEVEG